MNKFYDAARDTMLSAADPFAITFFRDVERPCRHWFWTRWVDRLRGRYHPRTHIVTEEVLHAALVDNSNPLNDEMMTVTYDSRGIFTID